jgi:hypothetical protein
VWRKEAEKKKQLQADDETIAVIENTLIGLEQDIPDQQSTKGEFELRKPVPIGIEGKSSPRLAQAKDQMEPFTLPDELKLTYEPDEDVDNFPQPEKRHHDQPPDAQPQDGQPQDNQPQGPQPPDAQPPDDQPQDCQPQDDQPRNDQPQDDQPQVAEKDEGQPEEDQSDGDQSQVAEEEEEQPEAKEEENES